MSRKIIGVIVIVLGILALAALYAKNVIDNISYSYALSGFGIVKLRLNADSIVRVDVKIKIKNNNPFAISVDDLFYQVYYRDKLLAETSSRTLNSSIDIPAKGVPYEFNQSVEVHINSNNISIIQNYMSNTHTDYVVKIKAKIFGFKIGLNKLKVTV